MRPKTIRVVHKLPQFPAEISIVPNTLESLQKFVGGSICGIYLDDVANVGDIGGYCDDEGLLKGLPLNFYLRGEPIVGPVVFSNVDHEGEEIGLTELQAELLCRFLEAVTL